MTAKDETYQEEIADRLRGYRCFDLNLSEKMQKYLKKFLERDDAYDGAELNDLLFEEKHPLDDKFILEITIRNGISVNEAPCMYVELQCAEDENDIISAHMFRGECPHKLEFDVGKEGLLVVRIIDGVSKEIT